jgi:hypothetical protein
MPIYQNKALQDQMMRVATQGQQRSINDKARQAAVAKAIGATGQVAAKAYSANAAEVMKQAKELGLRSPEEIAGLKKVMEASARTGLSVEEIMNSDKMMKDLQKEAMGLRKRKDSLDESIGELREMRKVKGEELGSLGEQYDTAEQATADARKRAKDAGSLEGTLGGPLPLGIDSSSEADTKYLDEKADRSSISSEMHRMKIEDLDIQDKIKAREGELKANTMSKEKLAKLAKLRALKGLDLTGEGLTAARRAVTAEQRLDKLASSNLVGRAMVGRMASEGAREGMKELTAQRLNAANAKRASTKDAINSMNSIAKTVQFNPDVSPEEQAVRFQSAVAEVGTAFGLDPAQAGELAGALVIARANEMAGTKYANQVKAALQREKAMQTQENTAYSQGKQDQRQQARLKQQREEGKLDRQARIDAAKAGRVFPPSNRGNLITKPPQLRVGQTQKQAEAEAQQSLKGSGKTRDGLSQSSKELLEAASNQLPEVAIGVAVKKTPAGILGVIAEQVNENAEIITGNSDRAKDLMRAVQAAAKDGNQTAIDILDRVRKTPAPSNTAGNPAGIRKRNVKQKRSDDPLMQ